MSGREEFDSEAPSNDWADLAAIASADTHQAREVLLAAFLADRESVIQAVARRCARRIAGVEWGRDGDDLLAVVRSVVIGMVDGMVDDAALAAMAAAASDDQWPTILWARSYRVVKQWQEDRVSRLIGAPQ